MVDILTTTPDSHRPTCDISVVIPLFNEQNSVKELYEGIIQVLSMLNKEFEIIFVDDGSTDESPRVLAQLIQGQSRVKVIQFRKNYGKSAALAAGFSRASGRYIITMDADLQDDPREIPALINKLIEGYDLVSGWKKLRHDPLTRKLASRIYNYFTSLVSGIKLHDFNCGLKAYRYEVINSIKVYGQLHRYMPVLAHREGFKVTELVVQHHPRKHGKSKFGFSRYLAGLFDLLTVSFLSRFHKRPMHLFGGAGLLTLLTGIGITGYLAFMRIFSSRFLSNRPILFLGILLIIVGIQFISIGLLGEMITASDRSSSGYNIKAELGFNSKPQP